MSTLIERLTPADQRANEQLYASHDSDDGWNKVVKKYNFTVLAEIEDFCGVPIRGSKVLDVGCGTGDFFPFLEERGVGEYLGIDVLSSSIVKARDKYPSGVFRQGDFLVEPEGETFDYAFCSGAFFARLPSGNWEYIRKMLSRMWSVSSVGIGFNYITDQTGIKPEDPYFVYSRAHVLELCQELFTSDLSVERKWFITARQDTVFLRKPQDS